MKQWFTSNAVIALQLGWLFVAPALPISQAAPGDLDTTFNGTGKSRAGFGGGDDYGNAVAVQTDGKTVVAGSASRSASVSDFAVARYNADGSLDVSFDGDGKLITSFNSLEDGATAVAIQTDGKIVVAGYTSISETDSDFAVARYHPDGSLDTSFGGDGKVTTSIGSGLDLGNAVIVQADGKIVVAGTSGTTGFTAASMAVVRYNPDGTLDTSFSGDGIAIVTAGNASHGYGAAIQSDGKIVVTGDGAVGCGFGFCYYVAVVRLNANGSLDTSFSDDGVVITVSVSGPGRAVVIQPPALIPEKIIVVGDRTAIRYNLNGSLDTSFDGDGIVSLSSFITARAVRALLVSVQGQAVIRIIVAGYSGNAFAVARLLSNGAFDTSFDGDGIALTPVGAGSAQGQAMTIQTGKIVVAGYTHGSQQPTDFAVVRYNYADGSLDTTFDGDGKRTDDIGDLIAVARSAAMQTDGKIVVSGIVGGYSFGIIRYNPDGSFDTSFDGDGKATGPEVWGGRAMAIQADGKIIVAGNSYNMSSNGDFAVVRLNPNGLLDTSFSNDGSVITSVGSVDLANAVAIQTDAKILVAGIADGDFALVRYNTDGSLDTSFDVDGKVITPIGGGNEEGTAIAIQTDGKILVAGYVFNGTNNDFAIVRYNPDGSLDTSFSFDGKQTTPIGTGDDVGNALAIQANGKILVAGYAGNGANNDFALARYNTDGSLDTSFDGDGKLTTPIGTLNDVGNALAIQANGKILVAGSSETAAAVNDFAVVRYNANGALDTTYSGDGKVLVDLSGGNDLGNAMALDSSGKAIVAGEANGLFGVARLLGDAVGAPAVSSAISRKVQGAAAFDIPLPLTGPAGVECRTGGSGGNHQALVTFANPVSVGGLSITSVDGLATGTRSVSGAVVTVDLAAVANAQTLGITLLNVNDGSNVGDVPFPLGVLLGDTTGNGAVSASDIGQTKAQSGQPLSAANFRTDVNANGSINATDIGLVKSRSGTVLP